MGPIKTAAPSLIKLGKTLATVAVSSEKTLTGSSGTKSSTKVNAEKTTETAQPAELAPGSKVLTSASQTPSSGTKSPINQRSLQTPASLVGATFEEEVLGKVGGATMMSMLQRQQQAKSDIQPKQDSGESPGLPSGSGKEPVNFIHKDTDTHFGIDRQRIPMKGVVDQASALKALQGTEYENRFTAAQVLANGTVLYGDPVQGEYSLVYQLIVTPDGRQIRPGDNISGPYRARVGADIETLLKALKYGPTENHGGKPVPNYNILNASGDEISKLKPVFFPGTTKVDQAQTFWNGINQPWNNKVKENGRPVVILNNYTSDLTNRIDSEGNYSPSGFLREAADYLGGGHVHHPESGTTPAGEQVRRRLAEGDSLVTNTFPDGSAMMELQKQLVSIKGKEPVVVPKVSVSRPEKSELTEVRFGKPCTKQQAEAIDMLQRAEFERNFDRQVLASLKHDSIDFDGEKISKKTDI